MSTGPSQPPRRDSFARRHRFAVGLLAGLFLALVALVILGLATGPAKPSPTAASSTGVAHYAAAATALCAEQVPVLHRLEIDEHVARADAIAGKITRAALAARYRRDLSAFATVERQTAKQIALLPPPGTDAKLTQLAASIGQLADVTTSESRAAGRGDQAAVAAYAKRADHLIDVNARLARAARAPACVL